MSTAIADGVANALARTNVESRRFTIARAAIDMHVAEEIAPFFLAPFAHLETPSRDDAELRIDVAPLRDADAALLGLHDVPESGIVRAEGGTIVHLHRHSAVVFDRAAGHIRALAGDANGLASWQRAKPLQLPLSIFFADRSVDLLHGGLVSLDGNGVLIVGAGGSGKSTLTVASLLEGLQFLGDDCVGVQALDGRFEGSSIFGSSCLDREHLQRFPQLAAPHNGDAQPKAVLPMAQLFAERMTATTTIRAIVLPRVTHGEHVTLEPASAKEALLALAPSSILKRAVPAAESLARMGRM
ncbi:MAG: hypothetical protein QOH21_751, partial [Acidobacteriota bacterium]|nr:hypothetical protein [Acidobacteriota bacterium]